MSVVLFDEIVIFNNLTRDDLALIVEIQLGQPWRRLADRKIDLRLTDRAMRSE